MDDSHPPDRQARVPGDYFFLPAVKPSCTPDPISPSTIHATDSHRSFPTDPG
jgi:hypothetical protein